MNRSQKASIFSQRFYDLCRYESDTPGSACTTLHRQRDGESGSCRNVKLVRHLKLKFGMDSKLKRNKKGGSVSFQFAISCCFADFHDKRRHAVMLHERRHYEKWMGLRVRKTFRQYREICLISDGHCKNT